MFGEEVGHGRRSRVDACAGGLVAVAECDAFLLACGFAHGGGGMLGRWLGVWSDQTQLFNCAPKAYVVTGRDKARASYVSIYCYVHELGDIGPIMSVW